MSRPGPTITRSSTRPARSAPTGTGPWFTAGMTGTVDSDARGVRKPCTSLTEYATRFGSRTSHGANTEMYDAAEQYFRDRGSQMFVSKTATAVDADLTTALGLFTRDLGPGQVSAPGRTTATARLILANHGRDNNRVFVGAYTNVNDVAALTAQATIAGITPEAERVTGLFGPWVVIPGLTPGSTRTISPESIVAAAMSRNDARGITPNQPSAGDGFGVSPSAVDVTFSFSDVDRTTLNANGVNLLRSMFDGVRIYGYRTLADPSADANYISLANARLFMAIQAQLDAVAERFVFRQIDGQRMTISEFGGQLTGVLLPFWERGSLYGTNPQDAFHVEVGENVNTEDTIENGELLASVTLRMSEYAEEVVLDLVKVPTTEAV